MEITTIIEENIRNRRTVKPEQFTGDRIDDGAVWRILEAANWAPTHGYTEPWRFIVYADEQKERFAQDHAEMYKSKTAETLFKQVSYDKHFTRSRATSHIIALIMKRGNNPKIRAVEEVCATACAVQNMQLLAASMGLGAYWNSGGMTYHSAMKTYLNLSEEDQLLGFLYLGVPSAAPAAGRRVSPISAKVIWEK